MLKSLLGLRVQISVLAKSDRNPETQKPNRYTVCSCNATWGSTPCAATADVIRKPSMCYWMMDWP